VPSVIDPSTAVGAVHLTIADLARSLTYYQSSLGLAVHRQNDRTARLGAGGPDLLVLEQHEHARPVHGATGLYHFALLVPSRADLARALRRLAATNTVLQGAADHGVSESLYLADPDGNGIEIYRDRPRDEWPFPGGRLRMVTEPLDFESLLAEAGPEQDRGPMPAGTKMGHVHLRVANLADAERFYVEVVGFELMQRFGPGALFVAAGGSHHPLGMNTWESAGAPAPPPGAIGLRHFELLVPDAAALSKVAARVEAAGIPAERVDGGRLSLRDPAGNALELRIRN
jgi:catechol 2,3-dioxygenase